jgi:hypothetical protein
MSNKNPLLGLMLLSALTRAAARQSESPTLDEMLGGRQKGKRINDPASFLDQLLNRRPWSEAPEELKQEARQAIKDGELEPNCDSPDCEFCIWIKQQPEWLAREGAAQSAARAAGDPGERFKQEYGEGVAVQQETVPGILREAASTYEQRNPLYGDAYKHYGSAMMAFFPQGLFINEPEDWNRFGLFSMMVSKMTRIANNITVGGHRDSSLDLSVYAAMMTELTEQK